MLNLFFSLAHVKNSLYLCGVKTLKPHIMTQLSKTNFISLATKKIEMYKTFQAAIDELITHSVKFNGKVMNVKFINFINELFDKKNLPVRLSFYTNYRNERENMFQLTFRDQSHTLDYNTCVNVLYPANNPTYIDETDFRLNVQNFNNVLAAERLRCETCAEDYQAGIDKLDSAISLYKDLEDYISTHMNKLPTCLQDKKYKYLNCPVY